MDKNTVSEEKKRKLIDKLTHVLPVLWARLGILKRI